MLKTTSDASATARGFGAYVAPRSISGWALLRDRLKIVTRYPAERTWPHIDAPITPVPIQPIRVAPGSIVVAIAMPRVVVRPEIRCAAYPLPSPEPRAAR